MRWTPGGDSSDIEDDRESSGDSGGGGFGFGGAPIGIGGAIVLLVLSLLFHRNFFALFSGGGSGAPLAPRTQARVPNTSGAVRETPEEHKEVEFVTFVLDDAQSTWQQILPDQAGKPYRHARLVLFRNGINSGCGYAQTAAGPFYCPADEKVYIDLAFYEELRNRFGAPGEFAQAYVIAHEIGHHVQKILGIEGKVHQLMERDPRNARRYSVRLELQADCFAGIWGHSTQQRNILESGDVEAGLNAAAAVGDDNIQRMTGHTVNTESFTHGSSKERVGWFRRGFDSGRLDACDTFH